MGNIKVILKYGQLIKIENDLFICNYKDWTVKFRGNRNEYKKRFETYLYYKGLYLGMIIINENDIDLSNYDILQEIIEEDNSCML